MTSTAAYEQAAHRARTIAEVARDRFADGPIRAVILTIAARMDDAARGFDAAALTPASVELFDLAATEVFMAEEEAIGCPAARFPDVFGNYILAPVDGRKLPMPEPLYPLDPEHAVRETDLRNRLEQLHADTAQQADHPAQWLRSVLTAWQKHMRLADSVRAHNGRP